MGLFLLTVDNFSFLLTTGAFLLSVLAFSLQLELFCLQWESASDTRALRDGKPRSLGVSKEAPTVS